MITGGNATIFVSDMDRAVDFYTRVLGLKLRMRAQDYWAEVQAGDELVIGLHPASPKAEPPGTPGSIQIGFTVGDLEDVRSKLANHNVSFDGDIVDDGPGRFARLSDPDGNAIYFWQQAVDNASDCA